MLAPLIGVGGVFTPQINEYILRHTGKFSIKSKKLSESGILAEKGRENRDKWNK
jgi:hypothetical protein